MTIYSELKEHLDVNPEARERRFKDKSLLRFILKKMGRESMTVIPVSELLDFAKNFESYNRIWRQVLQENPDLRGSDYSDGKVLSQDKALDLGYSPLFPADIKRNKQLSL